VVGVVYTEEALPFVTLAGLFNVATVLNVSFRVMACCKSAVQEVAFAVVHENVIAPDDAVGWLAVAVTLITSIKRKEG
jgi:hypothetical protein